MTNKFTCARTVLGNLAALAKVPEPSRLKFRQLMLSVLREAKLGADSDARGPHARTADIVEPLKSVRTAALNLEKALATLQSGGAGASKRGIAGAALAGTILHQVLRGPIDLDAEFAKLLSGNYTHTDLVAEYRQSLARLIDATAEAEVQAQGWSRSEWRPRSTGDNYAFVRLITRLDEIAEMTGGHWTNYRDRDQQWKGTFIEALYILQPYLPNTVFPTGELGGVINHIRQRRQAD